MHVCLSACSCMITTLDRLTRLDLLPLGSLGLATFTQTTLIGPIGSPTWTDPLESAPFHSRTTVRPPWSCPLRSSLPRIGQLGPRSRGSGPTDQVPQIGLHASTPMDLPAQIIPWDCPTLFGPHGSPLALASSTWPPCIGSLGPALSDHSPRGLASLARPPSARRFRLSALCSAFSARPSSSALLLGTDSSAQTPRPLGSAPYARPFRLRALGSAFSARPSSSARRCRLGAGGSAPRLGPPWARPPRLGPLGSAPSARTPRHGLLGTDSSARTPRWDGELGCDYELRRGT